MLSTALAMLVHTPTRVAAAILGTTIAFFLSAAQVGILVGWCNTATAIIRRTDADLWIVPQDTRAFDYATAIPDSHYYVVKSLTGVRSAERLYTGWLYWQRSTGQHDNVELIGLDHGLAGGPPEIQSGSLDSIFFPDSVVVDEMYLNNLGVTQIGDEFEIDGRKAVVRGICRGARTLTAIPFVFTSIDNAIKYDRRYRDDEITYVAVQCDRHVRVPDVCAAIQQTLPGTEAITSEQFMKRTIRYWMLETGLGLTVVVTAILGMGIGSVVISQTLYAVTNDYLPCFATMLAIGFSQGQIIAIIVAQALFLGLSGIICGTALVHVSASLLARTPVLLLPTWEVMSLNALLLIGCCILASLSSVRKVFTIDPVTVFQK